MSSPTAARRKEVAAAIETVLSRHDFLTRMVAAGPLAVWCTREHVPALLALLHGR